MIVKQSSEDLIKEKGLTGRRVSKDLIDSRIKDVEYKIVEVFNQKFTYCFIKMDNKFVVVGNPAACIDPNNWDKEIGEKISYENSYKEIWKLEAYRMLSGDLLETTWHGPAVWNP